jgi:uncharacterized delta-60 repeat protein
MRTLLTARVPAARTPRRTRAAATLLLSLALTLSAPTFGVRVVAVGLDAGFGGDGLVTTDLGGNEWAQEVTVLPGGKLLVLAGPGPSVGPPDNSLLLRYNADGSTDAGFGNAGRADIVFPGSLFFANDLAIQPDGKIVLAGAARPSGSTEFGFGFGVARYLPDGSPDTAFGAGGLAVTDFPSHSPASAVVIQPDGKLVVAGWRHFDDARSNDFAVARYLPNGSPDTAFGSGGSVTMDFGGQSDSAQDVLLQPDGKIVLAGGSSKVVEGEGFVLSSDFALARFNPDGSHDSTFDADGRVTTSFFTYDFLGGVALAPDGKLLAAGSTTGSIRTQPDFATARYLPDGSLDASFGGGGKVLTDFDGGVDEAMAVAVRPDGRVVVAGYAYGPGSDTPASFALAFYNPDGTHDNTSGTGGRVMTRFRDNVSNLLQGMTLQPDGKVVAVGGVAGNHFGQGTDIGVARYEDANAPAATSFVRFASEQFAGSEGCAPALVTVTREGDLSGAATVTYRTRDGSATQQSDFTHATGTLNFAPGETSKSFAILLNEDAYVEGEQTLGVELTGASPGVNFRRPDFAALSISDDDVQSASNPIDDAAQFVCQQYHDFLSRQADAGGFQFWTSQITSCGGDQSCIQGKRQSVSAAFFLSIEFQQTGYFVIRMYKAAHGDVRENPRYLHFLRDAQRVGRGVRVGVGNWPQQLDDNKSAFAAEFVARPEFIAAHGTQSAEEFVDSLFANAGVAPSQSERSQAVAAFGGGGDEGRARALRAVAESGSVYNKLYNSAFVLMQYYGYMRRNPDDFPDFNFRGYDFWLSKLNSFSQPGEDVRDESVALSRVARAQMVEAFITSIEYRQRFAP